jgi:hypothetical protein
MARAYVASGDHAKAHSAYANLFDLCKNADPEIPIVKKARTAQ